MAEPASPAGAAAAALLEALVARGLTHVVVSPGSRSQALALAAARLEREGRIRLAVRIDERVGGFTALGIARETGRPAAVVVTSGTAVAELHPAVLEAFHSGVPMLLLTADRPAELRGTGSNQTTEQPGLFAPAVRAEHDVPAPAGPDDVAAAARIGALAWDESVGRPGPVHVNLQYREPLSGPPAEPVPAAPPPAGPGAAGAPLPIEPGPRTVVVAGDGAGERAEAFARALGVPLLAEVSSGARFGPHLVAAYRELLDEPELGGRVQRAVVFGHPTLSRQVPRLLARPDVEVVVVRAPGERFEPTGGRATTVDGVVAAGQDADRAWTGRWVTASRALVDRTEDLPYVGSPDAPGPRELREHTRAELAALRAPVTRRVLVDAVWRATWPHDRLVLGASRLIREADQVVPGKRIRVLANRGLAGIDGTIATATGVALGLPADGRAGTVRVLLGDLALLHDAGALLQAPGEPVPRLQVIVGNDLGGTIFDTLEVAGTADPADFERVVRTPRPADLEALARAYGWSYRRIETRGDLDRALTAPEARPSLLEVPLSAAAAARPGPRAPA
ncbi:2-succinyl-5-enolpyruvyl-6-hydroxy-3-cyclohexene-1-carboxylic-acid synthase [Amnibacterium sp. CER49]|uniref:2-succinyl-5-enolpyruvyl-6-hydroxy-3- cyclohexene-1-carboxylic-acid synthase n=1 Tax=Amnibacterium sp. CER49 TaxID=3039161 RepID=UPI0024498FBC|nr:2-succinyl-5-enolpyruvyl-6-hydroxy-3-cyclohexene-1-carboxylic-acid synthase [Amnibacterium sp. CER49]MDH2443407.1 2-succinyl-5-enolpyruvyl-6-hydroxy-3-cyclohexene-1-carboxylic-acid synthase [Amnibacterium sp. CER49]